MQSYKNVAVFKRGNFEIKFTPNAVRDMLERGQTLVLYLLHFSSAFYFLWEHNPAENLNRLLFPYRTKLKTSCNICIPSTLRAALNALFSGFSIHSNCSVCFSFPSFLTSDTTILLLLVVK